jgi:hypothetical protein
MRRLGLSVVVVAAGLTLPASAQSLKKQLVGTWALTSCDARAPWCAKPGGLMILDASGYYTILHVGLDRPKIAQGGRPRAAIPADEYKALAMGVQANFGTWSVDEANKTLTWHIEGALFTGGEGSDFDLHLIDTTFPFLNQTAFMLFPIR